MLAIDDDLNRRFAGGDSDLEQRRIRRGCRSAATLERAVAPNLWLRRLNVTVPSATLIEVVVSADAL
uniref:Uncharacterized protein n=1 Tax=Oryza glumipatula TaxID=40148 RepID=A0A0D9Z1R5_9ORYZ